MYHMRGGSGVRSPRASPSPTPSGEDYVHAIGAVACHDGASCTTPSGPSSSTPTTTSQFPLSQVVRRDRVTGDEDTITDAHGSAFRPVLSPDGTKLVYGTRVDNETGLRIRDLRPGEERWLKLPVQRDEQESRFTRDLIPGYAFTPDGKSVLAAYGGKIHRIDVAERRRQGDPVLGEGVAAGRLAAEFPDPGGRRSGAGAVDPGARRPRPTASAWRSRR